MPAHTWFCVDLFRVVIAIKVIMIKSATIKSWIKRIILYFFQQFGITKIIFIDDQRVFIDLPR